MSGLRFASSLLAATAAVAFAAGVAGASALSVSGTTFRDTFSAVTFNTFAGTVSCSTTLQGVLPRDLEKTAGGAAGAVTEAALGSCTQGAATLLTETLPWDLTYSSFTGTLPTIQSVRLATTGFAVRLEVAGSSCLYRATATSPARLTANVSTMTGQITGMTIGEVLSLQSGTFCAPTQGVTGSSSTTAKNAGETLLLRLVTPEASEPMRVDPLYGYIRSTEELTPSIRVTNKRTSGSIEIAREAVDARPESLFRLLSDTCEDGRIAPREAGCVVAAQYIGGARNRPSLGQLTIEYRFGAQTFRKVLELIAAR